MNTLRANKTVYTIAITGGCTGSKRKVHGGGGRFTTNDGIKRTAHRSRTHYTHDWKRGKLYQRQRRLTKTVYNRQMKYFSIAFS